MSTPYIVDLTLVLGIDAGSQEEAREIAEEFREIIGMMLRERTRNGKRTEVIDTEYTEHGPLPGLWTDYKRRESE